MSGRDKNSATTHRTSHSGKSNSTNSRRSTQSTHDSPSSSKTSAGSSTRGGPLIPARGDREAHSVTDGAKLTNKSSAALHTKSPTKSSVKTGSKLSSSDTAASVAIVEAKSPSRSKRGSNDSTNSESELREMSSSSSDSQNAICDFSAPLVEQETDIDQNSQLTQCESSATIANTNTNDNQRAGCDASLANALTAMSSFEQEDDDDQTLANDLSMANEEADIHLPAGWEKHSDTKGVYYWHVSTGIIQRTRPCTDQPALVCRKESLVLYHDDEEINQQRASSVDDGQQILVIQNQRSADGVEEGDDYDYDYELGAALTAEDGNEPQQSLFVVYPLGSCEFDETQLVSTSSNKAIQKCILRLSNQQQLANSGIEQSCWGLDQSQPILMKLYDEHIQFMDLATRTLLRSQPIYLIKTWAVDDDNNFAFVIEDKDGIPSEALDIDGNDDHNDDAAVEHELLREPSLMCYVFRSLDDDDMSCKVAAKLNQQINKYKENMNFRITKSTRMQQMVVQPTNAEERADFDQDLNDAINSFGPDSAANSSNNTNHDDDDLEASHETTMHVKYLGSTNVTRPTGIDVLNLAIDKCLDAASKVAADGRHSDANQSDENVVEVNVESGQQTSASPPTAGNQFSSGLVDAKLHVSPSSVIVEAVSSGEIMVECRIRYLTFMGISRRDIRWCGFIMQNSHNKTFTAHCFECQPSAGHVCDAIQASCTRMYEKVVMKSTSRRHRDPTATVISSSTSMIPSSSKIRTTLVKTFSRIRLNPVR